MVQYSIIYLGCDKLKKRVIVKQFTIDSLENRKKKIRIILPEDYYKSTVSYPVLYMHDGQYLVDKAPHSGYSWEVLKTMDELSDKYGSLIIVGLDSHEKKRVQEYSPILTRNVIKYINKTVGVDLKEIKPEADQYGEFIINQVKPYVDKDFRTKPDRDNCFIAGSSCGGIISIYLGLKYQDVFSIIGALSPAYWFVRDEFYSFVERTEIKYKMKLYHDMGTKENGKYSNLYLEYQKKFDSVISKKIVPINIKMIIEEGSKHNEYYWANRFKEFYRFIFSK